MYYYIGKFFLKNIDRLQALIPRRRPSMEKIKHCKLISHRGEHDNKRVFENTIAAFDKVLAAGVWGIEFDVRWSQDLVPMVFHDQSLRRLFNSKVKIQEVNFNQLRADYPLIPSLEEVIQRYGKKLHLMIELKAEIYPKPDQQMQILQNLLRELMPIEDYHFISLSPGLFDFIKFVPSKTFLPVSTRGYQKYSALVKKNDYGGILGHYQFLTKKLIKEHHALGQKFGVGYVASKNSLFRELNRDITWIFSNNAVAMKQLIDDLLRN